MSSSTVGVHRRSAAVIAEAAVARKAKADAKNTLPAMNVYLGINNPNSNQQRDQITLLTNAQLAAIGGTIGV